VVAAEAQRPSAGSLAAQAAVGNPVPPAHVAGEVAVEEVVGVAADSVAAAVSAVAEVEDRVANKRL
jgi:hypothetical protein